MTLCYLLGLRELFVSKKTIEDFLPPLVTEVCNFYPLYSVLQYCLDQHLLTIAK